MPEISQQLAQETDGAEVKEKVSKKKAKKSKLRQTLTEEQV